MEWKWNGLIRFWYANVGLKRGGKKGLGRIWKSRVARRRSSKWLNKWDRCTHEPALHWSSALVEAAAELTQHPSSPPIPRSLLCLPHSLTHCISPADWGISTSTDWDSLDSSARGLCVNSPAIPLPGSFSHGLWCSLWVRSCGCACQSKIMDQRGARDSEGNWVTGRLSWLMPVWTWRDGVHHQHGCVWWAAYCPGEEL